MRCPFDKIPKWFNCLAKLLPALIAAASVATAVIPNPTSDTAQTLVNVRKILEVLALQTMGHNAQHHEVGTHSNVQSN